MSRNLTNEEKRQIQSLRRKIHRLEGKPGAKEAMNSLNFQVEDIIMKAQKE